MVYINFPAKLSEEEECLKQKFAKLRAKRKKMIQAMKNTKQENQSTSNQPVKRAAESAVDAREKAKKLIKSGAVKINEIKEKGSFKRPKNYEKKMKDDKPSAPSGFQPFSASQTDEFESDERPGPAEAPRSRVKGLYDSFVSGGPARDQRPEKDLDRQDNRDSHSGRRGRTIRAFGHGISEDILRKALADFGTIVNVTMEPERNCGFVTFDTEEAAEQAISSIHNTLVSGVQLRISLARRQPSFENIPESASTQSTWTSIASSNQQKGSHKDKRNMVQYTEEDDIFS